jgi:hypothetical protein
MDKGAIFKACFVRKTFEQAVSKTTEDDAMQVLGKS